MTIAAGEDWDDVVAHAVERGWVGVEALSGIPGSVGATPIQNVGAYGQEVAQTIAPVRVWDRVLRGVRTLRRRPTAASATAPAASRPTPAATSSSTSTFQLRRATSARRSATPSWRAASASSRGGAAPLADVRAAVLALRAGKGMVLDAGDHDTWSAGSFFTNPFLTPEQAAGAARRRARAGRSPTAPSSRARPG